jgi:hypothetical protein
MDALKQAPFALEDEQHNYHIFDQFHYDDERMKRSLRKLCMMSNGKKI